MLSVYLRYVVCVLYDRCDKSCYSQGLIVANTTMTLLMVTTIFVDGNHDVIDGNHDVIDGNHDVADSNHGVTDGNRYVTSCYLWTVFYL